MICVFEIKGGGILRGLMAVCLLLQKFYLNVYHVFLYLKLTVTHLIQDLKHTHTPIL